MASLGEDLLKTVNKLQDLVFNTIGQDSLDLPQIVVVGSQSSGKSSVLENIVGCDFLPRGSGIVTRRPLVLQLINVPNPTDEPIPTRSRGSNGVEWGEFMHLAGQKFYDFSEIKREIENETARIAGTNKGISRNPIQLKIFSPSVLSLTLVDLPGLTKVPIGDQPTDIEKQTRNLILEYIAKPNSIILAVSPANVDLVNSEALKLARAADPAGKRTIGVLTKIDLMDHGTNALDILSGRVYPLKLGFIGVVNRSQHDIQSEKPLSAALDAEKEFFQNHPAYRGMAGRCGTPFLAKTLNTTLLAHIRERLPDIKARLNTLMGQTQQELSSYGDAAFTGEEHRGSLILQLMTKFATSFIASIDGTSSEISTKELCGGARVYYIFNSVFGRSLDSIDPNHNLSLSDIRTAIRNSTGPRPSLFVPEMAFELLIKPQIKLLEIPSQRCVELVYEELIKTCHTCGSNELSRYPRLQARLIEVVSELLRERLGPCSSYVESLIAIQRAYINTNHPNFLGAAAAIASVIQDKQEKERKLQMEQRKSERRRLKDNGSVAGDIPEEDDDMMSVSGGNRPSRHIRNSHSMSKPNGIGGSMSQSGLLTTNAGASTSLLGFLFSKDGGSPPIASSPASAQFQTPTINQRHGNRNPMAHGHNDPLPVPHNNVRRIDTRPVDLPVEEPEQPPTASLRDMSLSFDIDTTPALSEREEVEAELIRRLITSYFNIVRESVADQVPKAIMHLLVNHSKDIVQNRLVSELYKESLFGQLLYEDENIKSEREKCERLLETYREAAKIIGEVL